MLGRERVGDVVQSAAAPELALEELPESLTADADESISTTPLIVEHRIGARVCELGEPGGRNGTPEPGNLQVLLVGHERFQPPGVDDQRALGPDTRLQFVEPRRDEGRIGRVRAPRHV